MQISSWILIEVDNKHGGQTGELFLWNYGAGPNKTHSESSLSHENYCPSVLMYYFLRTYQNILDLKRKICLTFKNHNVLHCSTFWIQTVHWRIYCLVLKNVTFCPKTGPKLTLFQNCVLKVYFYQSLQYFLDLHLKYFWTITIGDKFWPCFGIETYFFDQCMLMKAIVN